MNPRCLWPFRGLAARVAATLAVALLPIGAIAVFQAIQLADDDRRQLQTTLLAATAEAAAGEALAISSAAGAVRTLSSYIAQSTRTETGAGCPALFESVVESSPQFSFAGFIDAGGILRCASQDVGRDVSDGIVHLAMLANPRPMVIASAHGSISNTSVIVTAAPVLVDGAYLGAVIVSVPHSRIFGIPGMLDMDHELSIVTFNTAGEVLSMGRTFGDPEPALPRDHPLSSLVTSRQFAFAAQTDSGEARVFAVVPIIPGVVHALGSWPRESLAWSRLSPVLFPLLMLVVGLIVAFGAVNALVIRHIRRLQSNLAEFSASRHIRPLAAAGGLPQELEAIDRTWTDLAEQLVHDEAALENMVREKNVLLKEVHHRVKNNLQMIASIVNLKIRRATSVEARRSLKEVQMRVMSIASVHRALYSSPEKGQVRADTLLHQIIDSTIAAGTIADHDIAITQSYAPVALFPDQAVPLLLLANEAVTNALKYMGRTASGDARLEVTLRICDDGRAQLRVANTCGTPLMPPDQVAGSGLGRTLIQGFATQISGEIVTEITAESYGFQLMFNPAPFDPEASDGGTGLDIAEEASGTVGPNHSA